jgi:DNA-binding NarL/FixJ family response regulator
LTAGLLPTVALHQSARAFRRPAFQAKLQQNDSMNPSEKLQKPVFRIAVVDSDTLRFFGLCAILESEPGLELTYASLSDMGRLDRIDVILLGNRRDKDSFHDVVRLKASYPALQIIVMGAGMSEETILKALASGAKGYVDEAASAAEVVLAVRVVRQGSVWVSRLILSMFVEHATTVAGRSRYDGPAAFTVREREVLEILVKGRSNKEIGRPLGIEVRTVKAHVAKLMRKVGVRNRIALSSYVIANSLL